MVRNSKAHVILICEVCEAGSLRPYEKYLAEFGGTLYLNDAEFFCCWAGLGQDGRIQQIAGPREDDPSQNYSGPKRAVCYAIFEIKRGRLISRKEFAASCTGYFSSEEPQNLETMTPARMAATRTCVCHVNNEDAGKSRALTGECLASTLYEYQQDGIPNARPTTQLFVFMWAFHFGLA